jgi:hypothetical protein
MRTETGKRYPEGMTTAIYYEGITQQVTDMDAQVPSSNASSFMQASSRLRAYLRGLAVNTGK